MTDNTTMTALSRKETLKELISLCREGFYDDFEAPLPLDRIKQALDGDSGRDILAAYDEGDCTLLHWVCYSPHVTLDTVKWLVNLYPQAVKSQSDDGRLPLHNACLGQNPKLEIVEYLVDLYPEALRMLWRQRTPLSCAIEVKYSYSKVFPMGLVRWMIKRDPGAVRIPVQQDRNGGTTVVHLACENNMVPLELLHLLMEEWPESLVTRARGLLPLHAIFSNSKSNPSNTPIEIVRYMLDANPDSIRSWSQDDFASLPLHLACSLGASIEVIKLLGDRYPEAHRTPDRRAANWPLHKYCMAKGNLDIEVIQYLVNMNPRAVQIRNNYGILPLTYSLERGIEVVRYLIDRYPDAVKDTLCFHKAMACENSQVMQYFVDLYPEGVFSISDDGANILHSAFKRLPAINKERLQSLLNMFPEAIKNARDSDGYLPLHVACDSYDGSSTIDGIKLLLSKYPDALICKNRNGQLPLHLIFSNFQYSLGDEQISNGYTQLLKLLLRAYPDSVKVADSEGRLPIHFACEYGLGTKTLETLIDSYPSSLQVVSLKHGLPIHCAAGSSMPNEEVYNFLIDRCNGCLDKVVVGLGLPLHCAARCTGDTAFRVLLSRRYAVGHVQSPILHDILRDRHMVDKKTIANRFLTEFGEFAVKELDMNLATPLHIAVTSDVGMNCIERIVRLYEEALMLKDKSNSLPLHCALRHGDPSFVVPDVLLEGYAEGVRVADTNGFLPLHVACHHGAPLDVVQQLVEIFPESILALDRRGELPLHKACRARHVALIEFLADQYIPSLGRPNIDGVVPLLLLCRRSGKQDFRSNELVEIGTIWQLLRTYPEAILPR